MLLKNLLINKSAIKRIGVLLMCLLFVFACTKSPPVKVFNLGLKGDSKTGAMMVSEGDTLWKISKRYRVALRDIIDLNRLSPPYHLNEGQRIKVPPPLEYTVRKHDSLYKVSRLFNVSLYKLAKVNNLQEPYNLNPGQSLRIPSSKKRVAIARSSKAKVAYKYTKVSPEKRPAALTVNGSKKPQFTWPVKGNVISTYGAKKSGQYNDGINISVPRRARVASAASGVVAYVGDDLKSYGNLILIRHSGGMTTAYAHLSSINVKKGARVKRRQFIGKAGSTGNVSSSQLHFEIRKGSKTYNPLRYL